MTERNARDHAGQSPSECQRDEHDEQDVRHAHGQVNEPADHRVRPSAERRGSQSEHECEYSTHASGQQADADTQRQSGQCACQHVTPQPVGAKEKMGTRRGIFACKIGHKCLVRQNHTGNRDQNQHQDCRTKGKTGLFSFVPSLHRPRAAPLRILGSITPYSKSAIRLPAKTTAAVMTVMPSSKGMSPPSPAVTAACPSPG